MYLCSTLIFAGIAVLYVCIFVVLFCKMMSVGLISLCNKLSHRIKKLVRFIGITSSVIMFGDSLDFPVISLPIW